MKERYYESKNDKIYTVYRIEPNSSEIQKLRSLELSSIPKDERFYVAKSRMRYGGKRILEGFFTGKNFGVYISANNIGLNKKKNEAISRWPESFEIDQSSSATKYFDDQLGDTAYLDWRNDLSEKYINGAFDKTKSMPFMVDDNGKPKYFLATKGYSHKVDAPEGSYMMDGIIQIPKTLFLLELFLRDNIQALKESANIEELYKIFKLFNFTKDCNVKATKKITTYAESDIRIYSIIKFFLRKEFIIRMIDSSTLEETTGYSLIISKEKLQEYVAKGIREDKATVQLGKIEKQKKETFVRCTPVIDLDPNTFYSEQREILMVPSEAKDKNGNPLLIVSSGKPIDGKIRALSVSDKIYNSFLLAAGKLPELAMRASDEELKKLCALGTIKGFKIDLKGKKEKERKNIYRNANAKQATSTELLLRLKETGIIKKDN